jgi:signal peptidase II
MQPRHRAFLAAFLPVLLVDRATKALALGHLPLGIPREVVGEVVRLTLVFNRNAAMNITLGPWSRWGFAGIAVVGVIVMLRLLRLSAPSDRLRAAALGLISAGAIGNLIDRLWSDRGVIDFIDIGIGALRFWTFNMADAGVTAGALLMALVLSRERPQAPPSPGA